MALYTYSPYSIAVAVQHLCRAVVVLQRIVALGNRELLDLS